MPKVLENGPNLVTLRNLKCQCRQSQTILFTFQRINKKGNNYFLKRAIKLYVKVIINILQIPRGRYFDLEYIGIGVQWHFIQLCANDCN